jgi:hydroxypyruvate isomerase
MRLAANIALLFTELETLARIPAAREAGFQGIELLFPYDLDPAAVRRAAQTERMPIVQINSPPGNQAAGEMGFASIPGREREFQESITMALAFLADLGCSQLHVLAGAPPGDVPAEEARAVYVRNLQWAADLAARQNVRLMIEPLNNRDAPGYALSTLAQGAEVLQQVGRANVGLQFDVYHCQIMGGDLTFRLKQFASHIRHVQISGPPERNEPDCGEVNIVHVLSTLAAIGYDGWVSAEYRPSAGTREGLGWMKLVEPFFASRPGY